MRGYYLFAALRRALRALSLSRCKQIALRFRPNEMRRQRKNRPDTETKNSGVDIACPVLFWAIARGQSAARRRMHGPWSAGRGGIWGRRGIAGRSVHITGRGKAVATAHLPAPAGSPILGMRPKGPEQRLEREPDFRQMQFGRGEDEGHPIAVNPHVPVRQADIDPLRGATKMLRFLDLFVSPMLAGRLPPSPGPQRHG